LISVFAHWPGRFPSPQARERPGTWACCLKLIRKLQAGDEVNFPSDGEVRRNVAKVARKLPQQPGTESVCVFGGDWCLG